MTKIDTDMNYVKLLRALIFIALFILYVNNFTYASNMLFNKINNNCIWIKYESIKDSSAADRMIDFLINNKINKVFFETYRNGEILHTESKKIFESFNGYFEEQYISGNDTTYLRGYDPVQPDTIISIIYNPTEYFMTKIDSLDDIQIYAWMDMYKLWSKNFYPDNQDHFYYKCPECLESDINGRSDKLIKLDKIQSLEWEGIFLSPLHPSVNQYLSDIVSKIMEDYNFNGILLDYIRYQNYYYGYNEEGIQLFEDMYNINPFDLHRGLISRHFGYSQTEIDSIQNLWDNYREIKITELVQTIKTIIDEDSLGHELLVSVKASPYESKDRWYQNWSNWMQANLVDYVVIENHTLNFHEFNYNNKILGKLYNNEFDLDKIIIGFNSYTDNSIDLANKILSLRLQKFNNISLYYYESYKKEINWYSPVYNVINFNIDNE